MFGHQRGSDGSGRSHFSPVKPLISHDGGDWRSGEILALRLRPYRRDIDLLSAGSQAASTKDYPSAAASPTTRTSNWRGRILQLDRRVNNLIGLPSGDALLNSTACPISHPPLSIFDLLSDLARRTSYGRVRQLAGTIKAYLSDPIELELGVFNQDGG
jgi:hypothetical protein